METPKPTENQDARSGSLERMVRHHIWCNYFMRPAEGCKMCEGLRAKYPEDCSSDELIAKHFPEAISRKMPNAPVSDGATKDL